MPQSQGHRYPWPVNFGEESTDASFVGDGPEPERDGAADAGVAQTSPPGRTRWLQGTSARRRKWRLKGGTNDGE